MTDNIHYKLICTVKSTTTGIWWTTNPKQTHTHKYTGCMHADGTKDILHQDNIVWMFYTKTAQPIFYHKDDTGNYTLFCTLCSVHYALLLTPICWKSSNTNVKLMAFALPLAVDPTSGIHSKTLDTAQPCRLLKPNWKPSSSHSISTPTNINIQFLL